MFFRWISRALTMLLAVYTLATVCFSWQQIVLSWPGIALVVFLLTELYQALMLLFAKPVKIPVNNLLALLTPLILLFVTTVAGSEALVALQGGYLGSIGTWLLYLGLVLSLVATFSIGRSFGVFAEVREVRISGAYKYVRHPIYASYFLQYVGIALAAPSQKTVAAMLLACSLQVCRAYQEELVLRRDKGYLEYADQTGMFFPRLLKRRVLTHGQRV